MATTNKISVIKVQGIDFVIDSTLFAGKTEQEWLNLIEAAVDFVVLASLPAANAENYATYHNSIVLIPASTTSTNNVKDEYIIYRSGAAGSYTYAWEKIGSTEVDLSNYVQKGTYTTSSAGSTTTSSSGAATVTTTSTENSTAVGTATITYQKANANTGSTTGSTTSNTGTAGAISYTPTFTGTKATLSQAAGTGSVKIDHHSIAAHSHTVNASTHNTSNLTSAGSLPTRASFSYVSGASTTATVLTGVKASSTASVVTGVSYGTTSVLSQATVNDGVLSFSAATVATSASASGTTTAVTGVTSNGTTTAVTSLATSNAYQITGLGSLPTFETVTVVTGATLSTAGATTLVHSQAATATTAYSTISTTVPAVSIEYTPQGSINPLTVAAHSHSYNEPAAHSHSIGSASATVSGDVSVAISGHSHEVTIPNHTHTVGNHTHNVTL